MRLMYLVLVAVLLGATGCERYEVAISGGGSTLRLDKFTGEVCTLWWAEGVIYEGHCGMPGEKHQDNKHGPYDD